MSTIQLTAASARERMARAGRPAASVRSRLFHAAFVIAIFVAVSSVAFSGGAIAQSTNSTWAEQERNRIAGILVHTDVTAEISDTPLKAALEQISDALGVSIVGRFDDPRHGLGLDPELPITLSVEQVPAYVFIERILALAEDEEPVTWQIRSGYVEVGTKQRLASPAAREVRTYHIADLLRVENFFEHPFGVMDGNTSRIREVQYELALELFDTILETVEPEAWEPEPARVAPRERGDAVRAVPARGGYAGGTRRYTADLATRGKWASMRFLNWDRLVVNAPDFVHRQLNGYPKAIRPKKEEPEKDAPEEDSAGPQNAERKPPTEQSTAPSPGADE